MKTPGALGSAILSAILVLPVAARHACVSVPTSPDNSHLPDRIVSPSAARLLLAQRLGLAEYHSFGEVDEDVIDLLNVYGEQHQSSLSDPQQEQERRKILFFVEGVEEPDGTTAS